MSDAVVWLAGVLEKATPGEWRCHGALTEGESLYGPEVDLIDGKGIHFPNKHDATSIAATHNLMPKILDALRAAAKVQKAYWMWLNNDPEWRILVNFGGPLPMEDETKELESALVALQSPEDAEVVG